MSRVGNFIVDRAYIWGESDVRFITCQQNAAGALRRIVEMMGRLMASKGDEFSAHDKDGRQWVEKTKLGAEILACLRCDLSLIKHHYPDHRLSPLYTLFRRFLSPLYICANKFWPAHVPILNAAVAKVRAFAKGEALGRRLGNLKRAERQNAKSCKTLLDKLRARYSKLLVVRLDLGYISNYCPSSGFRGQAMTLKEVQAHRDQFLADLRKGRCAGYLAGYIWKMEYALEKGYHFHMAIFFDGQHRSGDIVLGDMMGRHWKEKVTDSKGMFFNCNKKKEEYARCGIGMINRFDDDKWEASKDALRYLTKADLYLRFMPEGRARTFGTGGAYGGVINAKPMNPPSGG